MDNFSVVHVEACSRRRRDPVSGPPANCSRPSGSPGAPGPSAKLNSLPLDLYSTMPFNEPGLVRRGCVRSDAGLQCRQQPRVLQGASDGGSQLPPAALPALQWDRITSAI